MTPSRALPVLLGASVAVSGCVAAVVPVATGATLGHSALKGCVDDVFPQDMRWSPSATPPTKE